MSQIGGILARNLKELRAQRGWKQPQLAEQAGLALESIKRLETDATWCSKESLSALARALGVPESRLFADPDAASAAERERAAIEDQRKALLSLILAADDAQIRLFSAWLKRRGDGSAQGAAGEGQQSQA